MLKAALRDALPHPVYRLVRKHRVAQQIRRYTPSLHTGKYGGHRLKLSFEDAMAEGWYGSGLDLPEIAKLKELAALKTGSLVFDLGAHQGVVGLILAREVGPSGSVVAVEAEPHNVRVAEKNKALNGATNVEVVHAAVTGRDGTVTFAEGLNGRVDETTGIGNVRVPAVTIDALCDRYGVPDVVFVDIEGYEGIVLRAAEKAMSAVFVIEVHVDRLVDATADEIVGRFDGYQRWVGNDTFEPFTGMVPGDRFFLIAAPQS